jgi:ATP-binding cassette subfamily B protein
MVAKHHGRYYPLAQLRNKSFITHEGVSLLGISDAAEAIGFRTIGVKISFEKLFAEAPMPCIVHWYQRHFVVVYKITKYRVYVADPASGLLEYSHADFKKGWLSVNEDGQEVGVALLLEPSPKFFDDEGEQDTRSNLSFLFSYVRTHKRLFFQLTLGLLTGSLIQLVFPFLTQSLVDVGINTQNVQFIYLVLAGQIMLFVGRTTVDFIRRWILLHLSTRINVSLISNFLTKLYKLPISFFETKMIGDILRRVDDHSRIERFVSTSTLSILFSLFNALVFGLVLALYNSTIFLIFLGMSILYVGYIHLFMKQRAKLDYKRFQEMAFNQSSLIETVHGMTEIKMSNSETQNRWKWERTQAKLFKLSFASTQLQQYQDGGGMFINEIKNMIVTVIAALAVVQGQMTMGMMLSVQYIIGQLNSPLNEFVGFIRDWQDAKISLERVNEIHLHQNEDDQIVRDGQLDCESGTVMLHDVSFQYEGPRSPKVLDQVDLIIPEGKVTAIVGSSGSGKTTLMKLLQKFYLPTSGKITLAGEDLRYVPANLWRNKCGCVMQDGYIFSDTIARNIAIGEDEIDRKKLLHAVKVANINEFIESLPLRFNTNIGKSGVGISQGQKQRILIARAVYKNPEVLFFDEATSALDANNERKIMENLDEFFKGKTVVVIAHRLSTVKNADQIVVLEQGKIVEVGSHQELTYTKGKYFELVKNQLELGA